MQIILETERLYLREMEQGDFDDLCKILQDEETMYAYEGAFNDEEAQEWLERQIARYRKWGFGLWAVVLKETGAMIGQCGLTMQPWKGQEVLEVGYLFQRLYWHKGYATEAANALKEYAFNTLELNEVIFEIRPNNLPSRKVAESLGAKIYGEFIKNVRNKKMIHLIYKLYKSN